METVNTAPRRPLGRGTFILTAVIVIGLGILNNSALGMAYNALSTNILYSSTVLPQLLFYLMAVVSTASMFIGIAAVVYSGAVGDKKGAVKSALILFAGLFASAVTTLFSYALEYSGEYFFQIINTNLMNLFLQTVMNLSRAGIIALISVFLFRGSDFSARLRKKTLLCVLFISGIAAGIELTEATVPFFMQYGIDIQANTVFTIALSYTIIAAHGALGYYICNLCYAIYEKRKPGNR